MSTQIRLVVAYTTNRCIGKDNAMPWHLPKDLAHFKASTMGMPIIMGRKTWDSIGRALPGRPNLIISRNTHFEAPGATVFEHLDQALAACAHYPMVSIIGGQQIFALALPLADEVVATEIHQHIEGDTFFPELDPSQWVESKREPQPEENGLQYDFVYYQRQK